MDALEGANGLAIVTEWEEICALDFDAIKAKPKTLTIFDGRKPYDPTRLRAAGLENIAIGRKL